MRVSIWTSMRWNAADPNHRQPIRERPARPQEAPTKKLAEGRLGTTL